MRRRGRPAFTPAPAAASPGQASAAVLLRSHTPGFDIFFYSFHPTIFSASFISSIDSLLRLKSSITQLLWEFASNSDMSALPLLRSADLQPAPWPLPTVIHPSNAHPGSSLRHSCRAKIKLWDFRFNLLMNWNGISFFYSDVVLLADLF
ncbi:hypothetical protein CRENBAI_008455 [Crenichthys baileyi]|uniref:Uncharacterized protein n=1 Tax=Crenichthys baileyi TaxID=28760 RepID=A0AAV9RF67_9TELE